MRTSRIVLLASLLGAGAIAGCGSSSQSSTSAQPAAAVQSSSAPAPAAASGGGAVITTKHVKFGTVLAYGPRHLTAYLFERDSGPHSTCTGECAHAWPPVTGTPHAAGAATAADLGTIKRADGTVQVTYRGHPLYGFIKDKDDEDVYGEGSKAFGAGWYVLAPSGKKIDDDDTDAGSIGSGSIGSGSSGSESSGSESSGSGSEASSSSSSSSRASNGY